MAYIGKFRDGWRVQVQRDGIRQSKTFATKRECQAWATEQEAKKSFDKGHTLRAACDHYLKTVTPGKRNADDWERRRFDALCRHFGDDRLMTSIDSKALGEWRDKRMETVSGSTVLREVNLYRNMFKLALDEWHMITVDPFKGVRLPKENAARVTVWRWQQVKRVAVRRLRLSKHFTYRYAPHYACRKH